MPAFESRRVRTQPLTVTAASFGASPARISRTLKFLSIDRDLLRRAALSTDEPGHPDSTPEKVLLGQREKAICGLKPLKNQTPEEAP